MKLLEIVIQKLSEKYKRVFDLSIYHKDIDQII